MYRFIKTILQFNDYNRDQFIFELAKSIPVNSKVLDAGAGTCKYKPLFDHCDYRTQDFGRYDGEEHMYGELNYISDITSIPVPDASFDYVICTEVLEHIPRPDLAIREFARILCTGGKLILTAPLGSGIHMPPYHFYGGFTPFWYQHFLPKYGFEIEFFKSNGGFFKHYGQESQRFLYMLTPNDRIMRIVFFPLKLILALWFKLAIPLVCHLLDRLDSEQDFTVGYFVKARKIRIEDNANKN